MATAASTGDEMTLLDKIIKFVKASKGFDRVLEKITFVSAADGSCVAEFTVEQEHTNPMGGLHGGFSATLVDTISTYALRTIVGENVHVSVDMNLTYVKGASIGDEVVVDARTLKTGKTLAFLEVELRNKKTGDLLVKGSHTKFITDKKIPW